MASPELKAWRRTTRERLIAERMVMTPGEHELKSQAISALLFTRLRPTGFITLGGYWPLRGEFDCVPLMRAVIEAGGQVALPAIVAPDAPLEFRPWTPEARMEAGRWNIPHPAEGPPVRPDVLLIPLVGFDARGYRLGYGGGFYDRTISTFDAPPLKIGVGFELSRLPTIQPQDHDVPMDVIVTEAGVLEIRSALGR